MAERVEQKEIGYDALIEKGIAAYESGNLRHINEALLSLSIALDCANELCKIDNDSSIYKWFKVEALAYLGSAYVKKAEQLFMKVWRKDRNELVSDFCTGLEKIMEAVELGDKIKEDKMGIGGLPHLFFASALVLAGRLPEKYFGLVGKESTIIQSLVTNDEDMYEVRRNLLLIAGEEAERAEKIFRKYNLRERLRVLCYAVIGESCEACGNTHKWYGTAQGFKDAKWQYDKAHSRYMTATEEGQKISNSDPPFGLELLGLKVRLGVEKLELRIKASRIRVNLGLNVKTKNVQSRIEKYRARAEKMSRYGELSKAKFIQEKLNRLAKNKKGKNPGKRKKGKGRISK